MLPRCLLFLFLSIATVLAQPAMAVQVIEDFEQAREWKILAAEQRGVSAAVVEAPLRQGKALRITWSREREAYYELYLEKALPVSEYRSVEASFPIEVCVDVYSPGTVEPRTMSVRLRDQKGETFQWKQRIDLSQKGWRTLRFTLAPDNIATSWGDATGTNGVMDGSLSFAGLTLDFDRDVNPDSDESKRRLFYDHITIQPGGTATSTNAAPGDAQQKAGAGHLDAIAVDLDTGHPMHIIDPANPSPAFLVLRNDASTPQQIELQLNARSMLGRKYEVAQPLTIPAGDNVRQYLPIPQDKQDFWWLYYTLSDAANNTQVSGREMLGIMVPVGNNPQWHPEDRFLFGMCAHTSRSDDAGMQAEAYAAGLIGVDIIRNGLTWERLQPAEGTWQWDKMDRIVELFKAQNIEVQYLFAYTPRWASTGNQDATDWVEWNRAAPRPDAWSDYIKGVVSRYRDDIRFYELWNEPDLPFYRDTPEKYVAMCRAAYPIIKSIDPNMTVLSGGWSGANRNPKFEEEVLPQVSGSFDVLALHLHSNFGRFQQSIDGRWNDLRQRYAPGKPLYLNETGLPSPGDTVEGDTRQAVELVRKITFTMSRGAVAYNWYDLRNDGDYAEYHEHRYGLVTRNFRAKPAYLAYNNLVRRLRGFKFVQQIDADNDQWLLLFQKDRTYAIVGWAQQPYAVGQMVVGSDAAEVHRFDLLGNAETPVRLSDGSVVLSLNQEPAYWEFREASQPPLWRDQLLQIASVPAFVPGKDNELAFEFTNPLHREARVSFDAQLPASWSTPSVHHEARISAGATQTVRIPIHLDGTHVDLARPFSVLVSYHDADDQVQGSTSVSVHWAGRIEEQDFGQEPVFVLDDRSQVFDLYPADPSTASRLWTGPEDLSAEGWLAATATHLKVRVVVTDDRHVQPRSGNDLWKSDSIQLDFMIPGQPGQWEFSVARHDDGRPLLHAGLLPTGFDASAAARQASLVTTETDAGVQYDLELSLKSLGLTRDQLKQGIYLSLLINEDDGQGRDGWIALSTGIGDGKDPSAYPLFVLQPSRQ